ncbi:MAG: hypothetical protein J3K34DRAFT_413114 [Monoraphidium minutum]|nr:MAG: hypothetical protein J3K34DRAFT_413114 [Monoraphidium minutum]
MAIASTPTSVAGRAAGVTGVAGRRRWRQIRSRAGGASGELRLCQRRRGRAKAGQDSIARASGGARARAWARLRGGARARVCQRRGALAPFLSQARARGGAAPGSWGSLRRRRRRRLIERRGRGRVGRLCVGAVVFHRPVGAHRVCERRAVLRVRLARALRRRRGRGRVGRVVGRGAVSRGVGIQRAWRPHGAAGIVAAPHMLGRELKVVPLHDILTYGR